MKKIVTILLIAVCFTACGPVNRHKKDHKKTTKVKSYKQKSSIIDSDPNNDYIFWYILDLASNASTNNTYVYYSSPTPVTSFNSVTWSRSATAPKGLDQKELEEMEQLEEIELDIDALPADLQDQVEEEAETEAEAESESESSSEGSDGDGDGGGGDGGGGDGGGGGD